jgi:hypothetical protein
MRCLPEETGEGKTEGWTPDDDDADDDNCNEFILYNTQTITILEKYVYAVYAAYSYIVTIGTTEGIRTPAIHKIHKIDSFFQIIRNPINTYSIISNTI